MHTTTKTTERNTDTRFPTNKTSVACVMSSLAVPSSAGETSVELAVTDERGNFRRSKLTKRRKLGDAACNLSKESTGQAVAATTT